MCIIDRSEVKAYHNKTLEAHENQVKAEREKQRWKLHPLYHFNTVLYYGDLPSVPTSLSGLSHLTIPKLKSILKYYHMPLVGNKDQLVLRVHLLRHNRSDAVTAREEKQLEDLVNLVHSVLRKQKFLVITHHLYRSRKYSLHNHCSHFVSVPPHIKSEDDLDSLFQPLISYMQSQRKDRKQKDMASAFKPCTMKNSPNEETLFQNVTQIGAQVKVHWTKEEVKDSGWKAGRYIATVHSYDEDTDTLTITYASEPDNPYAEELTPLIEGKLLWCPI